MSFYDEIEKLFNIDEVKTQVKICIYGLKSAVLSGYSKIVSFDDSEIVVKLANGSVILFKGVKLEIKRLAKSEIAICGEILAMERVGGKNG